MGTSRTTAIALGTTTLVAVAFTGGLALGRAGADAPTGHRPVAGPAGPRPAPVGPGALRLVNADLTTPASCEDLLDRYVAAGVDRVTAWGWDGPSVFYDVGRVDGPVPLAVQEGTAAGTADARSAASPETATSSATGTNVQEAGVDEPDVVKTDGSLLVRVQDGDLVTYDVTQRDPVRLATLDLPGLHDPELLLVGDRVVVTGTGADRSAGERREETRTLVVDVADPAEPTVVDEATYDAGLVTARQHGTAVRLVLDAGLPDLDFVHPARWRSDRSALAHNRELVRESELSDWLPTVRHGDGEEEALLGCGDVAIPADDAGLGTLAVVGLDPATPETWSVSAVATSSQLAYFSPDRMYLATGPQPVWGCCFDVRMGAPDAADGATHLYAFELDGTRATYVASGQVDGSVRDRWSMDEADGFLRVAVGPTQRTGNFNSVVTLEEQDDRLVEVGRVDKLGIDETIRSVRWFDGLAFVVTFRQVDPLYAVDLSDPRDPRLLGELKIPGYSEYLHPLGRHRLVGVGQDATARGTVRGAKTALFDVSDLGRLRTLDTVEYGRGTYAGAGADPRQFTWLPDRRTALTVISRGDLGRTGWVSVLTFDGGPIENRMVEVEYGMEVDEVRTVPLPDGRVLLVTGEQVSDFPL